MKVLESIRQENQHNLRPHRAGSVMALFCLAGCLAGVASAQSPVADEASVRAGVSGPEVSRVQAEEAEAQPDYSEKSDYQLTELGARWDDLSRPERDALLREVKLRMAQRNDSDGVLIIRTQRRYGRIYHSEGRYLKIETKVVQMRSGQPSGKPQSGFGTGFEQRTAVTNNPDAGPQRAESTEPAFTEPDRANRSPPVVRVRDSSG
jgi:hypothetical protein